MFLVYGSGFYGKIEDVEGVGHVATEFFHLFWVPIVPKGTCFLPEDGGEVPISLSLKSVMVAYARVLTLVLGFGAAASLLNYFNPNAAQKFSSMEMIWMSLIFLGCIFTYIVTTLDFFAKASYLRACKLVKKNGDDPGTKIWIDLHYGHINDEEAQQRMQSLEDGKIAESNRAIEEDEFRSFGFAAQVNN